MQAALTTQRNKSYMLNAKSEMLCDYEHIHIDNTVQLKFQKLTPLL